MKKVKFLVLATLFFVFANINAASAPGLTYLQIKYVYLSNKGWVPIQDNQLSIVRDNGASLLAVFTVEVGYGYSPIAKMSGIIVPTPTLSNFQPQPFCDVSNFLAPCKPGQKVAGWTRYWLLSGNQSNFSGMFYYQNSSSSAPFKTMSDQLYIY